MWLAGHALYFVEALKRQQDDFTEKRMSEEYARAILLQTCSSDDTLGLWVRIYVRRKLCQHGVVRCPSNHVPSSAV